MLMRLLHPAGCDAGLLCSSCGTKHLAGCATSRRHHDRAAAVPRSVAGSGPSVRGQELQWAELVSGELWLQVALWCTSVLGKVTPGFMVVSHPLEESVLAQPCRKLHSHMLCRCAPRSSSSCQVMHRQATAVLLLSV